MVYRSALFSPMNRITDAISVDHSEILACSNRITQSEDTDEQNRYRNLLVWELARHVVGEELVLCPALEKHLRDEDVAAFEDRNRTELASNE